MNISQRILRFISPACERQRMEFRHEIARVKAHTEDLMRTMKFTPEEMEQWKSQSGQPKT